MAGTIIRDGFDGADVVVRGQDVECFHVGLEELDLAGGELAPVHAGGRGPLEQGVIDVGDVLDVGDAAGRPSRHARFSRSKAT